MILQALNDYYERLRKEQKVPEFGYSIENLSFSLILSKEGDIIQVRDLREQVGNKLFPKTDRVPKLPRERSGKDAPSYFMWDKSKYILGCELSNNGEASITEKQFSIFSELHRNILNNCEDDGAQAILNFIAKHECDYVPEWASKDLLRGGFIVFELDGVRGFLHSRTAIKQSWEKYLKGIQPAGNGQCLITGNKDEAIPSTHPQIKGVPGAQSSGASLVSFNFDSAISFQKQQNLNAPISERVAFAYITALNYLLAPGSKRKIQLGDTTIVFWADIPSVTEEFFGLSISGRVEDEDKAKELEKYLEAVSQGKYPHDFGDSDTSFYVLGLSPNASRLSVRFWYIGTVGDIALNIGYHYNALRLKRSFESDPKYPPPWLILKELAPQRDTRNMSPLLSGQFISSILQNKTYPRTLITSAIERIRADRHVNYLRACILKAYLIRNAKKEISMSLDKENPNIGYRLGRLFAIIDIIQSDAVPGANSTVKDRFFGAASATPARIFPVILKNAQHGLAKIRKEKPGWAITLDKAVQEILGDVSPSTGLPATLSLENQGMFVLGYYQQRQEIFSGNENKSQEEE